MSIYDHYIDVFLSIPNRTELRIKAETLRERNRLRIGISRSKKLKEHSLAVRTEEDEVIIFFPTEKIKFKIGGSDKEFELSPELSRLFAVMREDGLSDEEIMEALNLC